MNNVFEKRHAGFNLLELSVSILLISMILWMFVRQSIVFRSYQEQWTHQLHETAVLQWITVLMRNSIRSAGFSPCLRLDHLSWPEGEPALPFLTIETEPQSQLTIRRMGSPQKIDMLTSTQLTVQGHFFKLTDQVIIADCDHAEIHGLKAMTEGDGFQVLFFNEPLHFRYIAPVYIGEWLVESYFIQNHALYYKHHRIDRLTPEIRQASFHRLIQKGSYQVHAHLVLRSGQSQDIDARVRAR